MKSETSISAYNQSPSDKQLQHKHECSSNQTTSIKKTFQTLEGSRNPQKGLGVFSFFLNEMRPDNDEVSEFSIWVVFQKDGRMKKATFLLCGVKQTKTGRIFFSFCGLLICAKLFRLHYVFLAEFLSRFMWIPKPLPGELCEPEP